MQTTIDLDDDLVEPAKALAARRRTTIDGLLSDFVRAGIGREMAVGDDNPMFERSASGILRLRKLHGGTPVTTAMVKALMNEDDEVYLR